MSRRTRPLVYGPQDWADVQEHYEDPSDYDEPMDDESQSEVYLRAIDEINGFYPPPPDHDRRYDDQYSQQQGDTGDEIPF